MANGTLAASQIEMLTQSGTGIVTIVPPATNTNRTLTLPDSTGTLLNTNGGTITGNLTVSGITTLGNGAVLGVPASGTVTNLTGTASININGTVGATTPGTGAFTTLSATGATTLATTSVFGGPGTAAGLTALTVGDATNATFRMAFTNAPLIQVATNTSVTLAFGAKESSAGAFTQWAALSSTGLAVTGTVSSLTSSAVQPILSVQSTGADSYPSIRIINDARTWQMYVDGTTADKFKIFDVTANEPRLIIDSSGTVSGGNTGTGFSFSGSAPATSLTLDSSGNLLVGTTSPNGKLTVASGATTFVAGLTSTGTNTYTPTVSTSLVNSTLQLLGGNASGATTGIRISQSSNFELFFGGVQEAGGAGSFVWQGYSGSAYAERMRLDSAGNLGLGVTPSAWSTSAQKALQVYLSGVSSNGGGNTASRFTHGCYLDGSTWNYQDTGVAPTRYEVTGANGGSTHSWSVAAGGTAGDPITFTQAMTLDASGRLLIGNTANVADSQGFTPSVQVSGTGALASMSIARYSANTSYPALLFEKSRGATVGTNTIVSNNDNLGGISFQGANGTGFTEAAAIIASVDGTPGASTDMPGRLVFYTTVDGAGGATEKMRLDSSGKLLVGTTTGGIAGNSNVVLSLANGNVTVYQSIRASGGEELYLTAAAGLTGVFAYSNSPLTFGTNNTERARIDSSGNLGIGTTSPYYPLQVNTFASAGSLNSGGNWNVSYSDGSAAIGYSSTNSDSVFGAVAGNKNIIFAGWNGSTNVERGRIDSDGNFNIGTTGGGYRLFVSGTAANVVNIASNQTESYIRFTDTNTNSDANSPRIGTIADGNFVIRTGGSERMRIDSSGNVGIGTTSPSTTLDVNGTVTATQYSSGLSGTTASLAPSASETILTVANYSMYLVYGGGTSNTSAMGMAIAQCNGGGTVTVTQLSGAATGFTLNASGSNIQITNNTSAQAYRWKAVRLINLD